MTSEQFAELVGLLRQISNQITVFALLFWAGVIWLAMAERK
jgi:hypothetical protein